jgi:hypothetical protein
VELGIYKFKSKYFDPITVLNVLTIRISGFLDFSKNKKTMFWNLDLFPSSDEEEETPTLLYLVEKVNHIHCP